MNTSFLEYASAMIGCYAAMPQQERDALHAWEAENVNDSGTFGTSDWPGWEKYIGKVKALPQRARDTYGYVYVVQAGSGHYKIGSSKSVEARVKQLQCASAAKLQLVHQFPSANAQQAERKIHLMFDHKRIRNEWFALSLDDITQITSIFSQSNI